MQPGLHGHPVDLGGREQGATPPEEEAIDLSFAGGPITTHPPAILENQYRGQGLRFHPRAQVVPEKEESETDSDIDEVQFEDGPYLTQPFLSQPPLHTRWNPYPVLLLLLYTGAAGFYFYIRIAFTLKPMGELLGYGIFIMAVEMLGLTAMLPYAILLVRSTLPNKNKGLPTEAHADPLTAQKVPRFRLHVLIPCYKEPIEVVSKTIQAAHEADLPVNCIRTVYLCDDAVADDDEGRTLQAQRREFIASNCDPDFKEVKHITGREKKKGEGNGKSNNVNNCLQNHIFSQYRSTGKAPDGEPLVTWHHDQMSTDDVVVIFDSDMVCNKDFFCKILEVMAEPSVALCLTPQAFTNINKAADVFNNVNFQFWEYWLPGSDAQGYIACTGTNFCIRAKMLAHAGWFPTYTITEDYALGMELKRRGYIGKYLLNYMVFGEAPDNIRNVFRQRSRWCKGHMQVFFSRRCPLLLPGLPFAQRLWYSYGTWCYFVSIVTIPVFMVAPILALIAGITPLYINRWFAIGATAYYFIGFLIQNYCRQLSHLKGLWFANISNTVLWFTYTKAVISVLSSKLGLKVIGFKATVKKGEPGAAPPQGFVQKLQAATRKMTMRMGTMMRGSMRGSRVNREFSGPDPETLRPQPSTPSGSEHGENGAFSRTLHSSGPSLTDKEGGKARGRSPPPQSRMARPPLAPPPAHAPGEHTRLLVEVPESAPAIEPKKKSKLKRVGEKVFPGKSWRTVKGVADEFSGNWGSMEGTWDLVALFIILLLCLATFAAGVYHLVHRESRSVESYANIGVPMMWALYNAVPAYLFIHYCFDKGKSLETASSICQLLQGLLGAGAMAFLWVLLPNDYNHTEALGATLTFFEAQQSGPLDKFANEQVPWLKASGESMTPTGGWFANGDHIKYTVPVANAAALLAWSYLQFPRAYSSGSLKSNMLHNLRYVGTYLKDCYSEDAAGQHYMYRAGDPHKYAIFNLPNNTVNADEIQPERMSAIWTSPDQDPQLQSPDPKFIRKLWKGKNKDTEELAADVLGSAAGALAAIATVFKKEDAVFSEELLGVAKKVFEMQSTSKGKERASCSIKDDSQEGNEPCWVATMAKVRVPFVNATDAPGLGGMPIKCWVPDWIQTTCVPSYTKISCDYGKVKGKNFLQPTDCCSYLQATNIWNGTTPKGICALPGYDFSRPCFVPNLVINSCEASKIDMVTGTGCGGAGLAVYPSAELCCNYMAMQGRFTRDRPAHGLCAPNLQECYIPSISQGACLHHSGKNCSYTGLENIYENPLGCCDYLTKEMQEMKMGFPAGVCRSDYMSPPPPPTPILPPTIPIIGMVPLPMPAPATATATPAGIPAAATPAGTPAAATPAGTPAAATPAGRPTVGAGTPAAGGRRLLQPGSTAGAGTNPAGTNGAGANPARSGTNQGAGAGTNPAGAGAGANPTGAGGNPASAGANPTGAGANPAGAGANPASAGTNPAGANPGERNLTNPATRSPTPPPPAPPGRNGTTTGQNGTAPRAVPPSPSELPFLEDITTPAGEMVTMQRRVVATFYNTTYMLDDMAWGAAWLYRATGDPSYLGEAEYYLEMHQSREMNVETLTSDPAYYISNWDNMAWATKVLLADVTKAPKYMASVRSFFNTWIGNAPRSPMREMYQRQVAMNLTKQAPGTGGNSKVMPDGSICTPTAAVEEKCDDGVDDDCNGLIDEMDLNCPFEPVKYMGKLAWTPSAPLPNAANAAFLALSLGNTGRLGLPEVTQRKLKCWALGQIDYILGESGRSYLVGYGDKFPLRPQHRGASCAANFTCNWGNFYSGAPNPHVLKGALVAGPDYNMPYLDDRTHPSSRVAVDYTAPLAAALAGIIQTKVNVQECSQWQGLVQDIFVGSLQV